MMLILANISRFGENRRYEPKSKAKCILISLWTTITVLGIVSSAFSKTIEYSPDQRLYLPDPNGNYLVMISQSTASKPEWMKVAQGLRRKHNADMAIFADGRPETALATLQAMRPQYVCVVARPEEAGRDMVVRLHRLMRKIDSDYFSDAISAILTGYAVQDAQRIERLDKSLEIKSGFSSMGIGLAESLGGGFASMETDPHTFWKIDDEGKPEKIEVKPDSAKILSQSFAEIPVDLMQTSGHASERDWQIAFNRPGGAIRSENGELYTVNTENQKFKFTTPNPKVYLPMGNCLIGHIDSRNALALAWMHTGGVVQMMGYTVVTFYGYMGWGVNTYFHSMGLSLSQSVHANEQALLYKLHMSFPDKAEENLESYDRRYIGSIIRAHRIANKDLAGMLWDRDTLAFYGDPGWVARMPIQKRQWKVAIESKPIIGSVKQSYILSIETLQSGSWGDRPIIIPLQQRITEISDVKCSDGLKPAVVDDMVLIPLEGKFSKGQTIEVSFKAKPFNSAPTSAANPVIKCF